MTFEIKVPLARFEEIRNRCRQLPDMSHESRANEIAKEFKDVSPNTLKSYSRIALGCTEKVWKCYAEGKVKLSILEEICSWSHEDQDFIVDQCIAKNLPPSVVRKVRRYKKEQGWGYLECIGKAMEEMLPQHRKSASNTEEESPDRAQDIPQETMTHGLLPGETKVTRELAGKLRKRCQELPDLTHEARASILVKEFPGFNHGTCKDYSRICIGCTEKVWNLYLEEKVGWSLLSEICTWEPGDQDFLIDECIDKKIGLRTMRKIRRYRNEQKWGFPECIAKATGEVDAEEPRREGGHRKGLDGLLTEIADKGARWRAMVTQAIELVGKEEAEAGIHEAIFRKVFLLRELIGNQYDFVNSRVQRYMNMIRKRIETGAAPGTDKKLSDDEYSLLREQADPEGDKPVVVDAGHVEIRPVPDEDEPSIQDRASRHEGS